MIIIWRLKFLVWWVFCCKRKLWSIGEKLVVRGRVQAFCCSGRCHHKRILVDVDNGKPSAAKKLNCRNDACFMMLGDSYSARIRFVATRLELGYYSFSRGIASRERSRTESVR
jgi:hypothetical protein